MSSEFRITRQVEFAETDMAGIMHFSNFFLYMEACEAAFFRSLGYPLIETTGAITTGWPRVQVNCVYEAPLRFGDSVEVAIYVKEIKGRCLSYFFRFRRLASGGPVVVACGDMTVVYASMENQKLASAEIPAALLGKIQVSNSPDLAK